MAFAGIADREAIESEMPWDQRDVPATLYKLLSDTADKFPGHDAVSYQIFSGPKDKAETLARAARQDHANREPVPQPWCGPDGCGRLHPAQL